MSLSIFLSHIVSFPIFHNTKAKVNSPTSPKRRTARLILSPTRIKSKNGTKCEPQPANEVPGANVPAEHVERGNIPAFLGLEHEERAGEDEAETADDLGRPVYSVGKG